MRENFSLIAHSQMKLCLFKVAKSDVCMKPLFANPVTYVVEYIIPLTTASHVCTYKIIFFDSTFCDNYASNGAAISVFYNILRLCNVTIANNSESAVEVRYNFVSIVYIIATLLCKVQVI